MTSKCGFVSIIGNTNSGKSTLLNCIIGEKISIVSSKIQTTRQEVRGIVEYNNSQIIFVDTPGFCSSKTALERALLSNFRRAYKNSDVVLMVIDCTKKNWERDIDFLAHERKLKKPFAIALNKVDLLKNKQNLLSIADKLNQYDFINEIFMISSLVGTGIEPLKRYLAENVPESPWLYFENHEKTDQEISVRLAEITRETMFEHLNQEIPYSIYVKTDKVTVTDKKIKLMQSIIVMKDTQKAIVLGHKGIMIKSIRLESIKKMREIFNKNIELKLFVIVRDKWSEKKEHLINAGLI